MNMDLSNYHLSSENVNPNTPSKDEYKTSLRKELLREEKGHQILAFSQKPAPASETHQNSMRVLYSQNKGGEKIKKTTRHIPQGPEKILDAPDLLDDYYLNLLDWSAQNILAVALGPTVYMWNATTGSIEELMSTDDDDVVTSVGWTADGSYLAVGTNDAEVQLWDVANPRRLRTMKGHSARVGSLAWNNSIVSSGSRDTSIIHHDVRVAEHKVATLQGHTQEVCGLKWSLDGSQLASGGNDNILNVWDGLSENAKWSSSAHCAAVKALAWCPFQANTLASGGGTADRKIRFWNTSTGACLQDVDTGSQVCALQWSKTDREIVSAHGFSQNQLTLWKYPTMTRVAELTGHTARVLHMAISPDGQTIASAAADETLRFWKAFGEKEGASKSATTAAARIAKAQAAKSSVLRSVNIR
jgi:cell division cycle protein 20 (cofactor of APC complex)